MKLKEILFWNSLYWILYFPTAVILHSKLPQGTIIGIVTVGLAISIVFSFILAPSKSFLFVKKQHKQLHYNGMARTPKRKPGRIKTEVKKDEKPIIVSEKIRTDVDIKHLHDVDNTIFS